MRVQVLLSCFVDGGIYHIVVQLRTCMDILVIQD